MTLKKYIGAYLADLASLSESAVPGANAAARIWGGGAGEGQSSKCCSLRAALEYLCFLHVNFSDLDA